jgi:membrane protein DedA with SNARE-associated domain
METLINLWEYFQANLLNGGLPFHHNYWNYVLLAVLVAAEGPIATLIGASAASIGFMRPAWVFLAASIGNTTSDFLWYSLGYLGKIDWLLSHGRWLGLRRNHLDHLKQSMQNNGPKILLVAKLTAGFVIPSLIATGLAKVPWRRWFPVVFTAEILWTGSLVLIGYYATETIKTVEMGIEYVGIAGSMLILVAAIWFIRKTLRQSEAGHEIQDDAKN